MSEKRRDNKGSILRTGESQRKDLIYQYRYTDIRGKRRTIYSSNLSELRKKEAEESLSPHFRWRITKMPSAKILLTSNWLMSCQMIHRKG